MNNMKAKVLLQSKINYEYFAEISKPTDPVEAIFNNSKTLEECIAKLAELSKINNKRYPGYVDFYYKFNYTQPSNGCYEAWFDLYGIKE